MNQTSQKGFTLTEMMLAMGSIAFLLLFVLFAILHATGLYTKGIAMRQINQSGRQIIDALSRDIRYSSATGVVTSGGNRLCVANKAYMWNTPSTNLATTNNLYDDPTHSNPPIKFVVTSGDQYCKDATLKVPLSAENLLGNVTDIQELSVTQLDTNQPIFDIRLVLSTAAPNLPLTSATSSNGGYECDPGAGQYCAFGEFVTSIYTVRQ